MQHIIFKGSQQKYKINHIYTERAATLRRDNYPNTATKRQCKQTCEQTPCSQSINIRKISKAANKSIKLVNPEAGTTVFSYK